MERLIQQLDELPELNSIATYYVIRDYLYGLEKHPEKYGEDLFDVLGNLYTMIDCMSREDVNCINMVKKAVDDFLIGQTGKIQPIEYKPITNFYRQSHEKEWLWTSQSICEVDIEHYTNQNGLCNVGFILSLPKNDESMFDVYVEDKLVKRNIVADTQVEIKIPIFAMRKNRIRIEKKDNTFERISGDERNLYFCIKNFNVCFLPKTGIESTFEQGFYSTNDEWKWASNTDAVIDLVNYDTESRLCHISFFLDVVTIEEPQFAVYDGDDLLVWGIGKNKIVEIDIRMDAESKKNIRIEKKTRSFSCVEGDLRNLFFCVKQYKALIKNEQLIIGYDHHFHGPERNEKHHWNWCASEHGSIEVENLSDKSGFCNISFFVFGAEGNETGSYSVVNDIAKERKAIRPFEKVELCFPVFANGRKLLRIETQNVKCVNLPNDNRTLAFCVSDLVTDFVVKEGIDLTYNGAFFEEESDGNSVWRWTFDYCGSIDVINYTQKCKNIEVTFSLNLPEGEDDSRFEVYLEGNLFCGNVLRGELVRINTEVMSLETKTITIKKLSDRVYKVPGDSRELYFSIVNPIISDLGSIEKPRNDEADESILYKRVNWKTLKEKKSCNIGGIDKQGNYTCNRNDIMSAVSNHDIVSFDLFDTLLMRKTLYPQDIFEILEAKAEKDGFFLPKFAVMRKGIQDEIDHANLGEIYKRIGEHYKLNFDETHRLMQMEVEIEKENLIPRYDMIEVFQSAIKVGKRVFIVSDMYLPEATMKEILAAKGIVGYKKLYVSCQYKKTKREGLLEVLMRDEQELNIVHIGDSLDKDIWAATEAGIDSYYVKHAVEMYGESVYQGELLGNRMTVNERSLLGTVISRLFNSPFIETERIKSIEDTAYCFFAPIVTTFMNWLWRDIRNNNYLGILFASRDGYLIKQLYEIMQNKLRRDAELGIYFLTSRAAASAAGITSKERLIWLFDVYKNFNVYDVLVNRLGFSADEAKKIGTHKSFEDLLNGDTEVFVSQSQKMRHRYMKYIDSLGLEKGATYAFYDFVSSGTCQLLLSEIMDVELVGTYFCKNYAGDRGRQNLDIHSYIENLDPDGKKTFFFSVYTFFEVFMTALSPAIICFDAEGMPVYDTEKRSQSQLDAVKKIQRSITIFFEDYISNRYIENVNLTDKFADKLLSMIQAERTFWGTGKKNDFVLIDDWINNVIQFQEK